MLRWSRVLTLLFLGILLAAQSERTKLSELSQSFLDTRSQSSELRLREFAVAHASHENGSLAHFALGYAHWQDKQYPQAASYFRLARAAKTPLSDYTDYFLASSLQNAGDHAAAVPLLAEIDAKYPGSPLIARARYALAVGLVATDSPAKAVDILQKYIDTFPRPAADLLLAHAYDALGEGAKSSAAYSEIYYRYPASVEANEAAKHHADFPHAAPKDNIDLLRIRGDLLMNSAATGSKAEKSRKLLEAEATFKALITASTGPDRERARVAVGAVLYKLNENAQARAELASLELTSGVAKSEQLYWLSECDRRLKREDDMLADIDRLEKIDPASPWREEALNSVASYELVHAGLEKAAPYYDMLQRSFPDGKYGPQSHWKVAWARYRAGDFEAARYLMAEQIKRYPGQVLTPAALYWSGRSTEAGDPAAAQAFYRQTVESYPSNFYGLLARDRLKSPVTKGGVAYALPETPPDSGNVRKQFDLMRALGLTDLEAAELRIVAGKDPKRQAYWFLDLAAIERERGRLYASIDVARRAVPNYTALDPNSVPRAVWELLYPRPWWPEVKENAVREGLDPYLVVALMRQESLFNERVISPANAYGLMQILPSTGRQLARKTGVRPFSNASLFVPRINIKLGTYYLKGLIENNGGRVEDALAAYNAGENRLDVWRRGVFKDAPEFIESIPFSETREYVQIVLRNAEIYKRLYPAK